MRTVIDTRLFVITSICLVFAFFAHAAEEPATAENFTGQISGDRVNVRASAATSSEILCQLKKDESVAVTGKKGKWLMIELPSKAPVYINKENVTSRDGIGTVSANNALLRTAATVSSSVVGKLNKGATVKILKEYLDWYEISAPKGSYGWIYSDYVKKEGEPCIKKDTSLYENLSQLEEDYKNELKKPLREIEIKWLLDEYAKFAAENKDTPEGRQAALKAEEIKLKIAEIEHLKAKQEYDAKIKNISSPRPGETPVVSGVLLNVGRISGRLSGYKIVKDGKFTGYVTSPKEDLGRYVNLPVNIWGVKKDVKGTALYEADAVQIIE
jgi:uncharacterized protein YgiM (DUF1202 family)